MTAWPSDNLPRPTPFEMDPGLVIAYFLSPSAPEFELVEEELRGALEAVCSRVGGQCRLERAITSTRPGIIHDEIWNALYHADILIFDVTGENASVMMELGVAAAWRVRPQVLVIQNANSKSDLPFNLMPARALRYTLSSSGLKALRQRAQQAFIWSLSTLPVAEIARHPRQPVFPFRFPEHSELLFTSPLCHRYRRADGSLEFGAPYAFRHSFALPHTGTRPRMRLEAEMQFLDCQPPEPDPPWIGFKLLGSGVLMNHGVGTVLRCNGTVQVTYQKGEGGRYRDPRVGQLTSFDANTNIVKFRASVSNQIFSVRVQSGRSVVKHRLNLVRTAGYRPSEGVCLIQAFRCRAVLKRLELK